MDKSLGYWIGVLFGGFAVGAICGILPLVLALNKKPSRSGISKLGLLCCRRANSWGALCLAGCCNIYCYHPVPEEERAAIIFGNYT